MSEIPTSDGLWRDMGAIYRDPDLSAACLRLQEAHGVDVPLLLTLGLLDRAGVGPNEADLGLVAAGAVRWRETAILPLRRVRQDLKAMDLSPAESALREEIKRLELEAERLHVVRLADALRERAGQAANGMVAYLRLAGADHAEAQAFAELFRRAGDGLPAASTRTEQGA